MQRRVGFWGSKNWSVGATVSDVLASWNACSWSGNQINSFLVLSSGRRGPSRPARASVLAASWLANPKKARRSVRLEGVGKLAMVSDGGVDAVPILRKAESCKRDMRLSVLPLIWVERDSLFSTSL